MSLLTIVAAVASNGVIGRSDGTIPWSLPGDLARFRRITWGKAMIMGRRTFQAIGRPLPGRRTIVVTRNTAWSAVGTERAPNLDQAVGLVVGGEEIIIAGGAEIYALALPRTGRLRLTLVDATPFGEVIFPPVDWAEWREVARESHGAEDGRPAHVFADFERV